MDLSASVRKRCTRGVYGILVAAVVGAAMLSAGTAEPGAQASSIGEAAPLPFDPPSGLERDAAAEIALQDGRVQEALADHRYLLLGVALGTDKIPGVPAAEHIRLLDVWFYDYSADTVVWAVVDLSREEVVRIVPVDSNFQPPLVAAEVHRARELALGIDAVADRFPEPLPVTAMLLSGDGTPCPGHRCAVIAFIEDTPVTEALVLVNLSQDSVVRVVDGWSEAYGP